MNKHTARAETTRNASAKVHIQGNSDNVFLGLDRNGDGSISPKEWPADRKSFDALDRNRDGKIGPTELRSRQPASSPHSAGSSCSGTPYFTYNPCGFTPDLVKNENRLTFAMASSFSPH